MKTARIGDMAIARFDDCEVVCLITGRDKFGYLTFIYSPKQGRVTRDSLPRSRFRAVVPVGLLKKSKIADKDGPTWKRWNLADLQCNNVVSIYATTVEH